MRAFLTVLGLCILTQSLAQFFGLGGNKNSHGDHIKGNSSYDLEIRLATKEFERFPHIKQTLENQGYEVYGFYHTSTWREHWAHVVKEQLKLLDGYRKFPNPNINGGDTTDFAAYEWDTSKKYTSLLALSKGLFLNVATGPDEVESYEKITKLVDSLNLEHRDKIQMHRNRTLSRDGFNSASETKKAQYNADKELSTGEYATIEAMQSFCKKQVKEDKKTLVYYMHMKGSCCVKDPNNLKKQVPVAAWREYMNAMNLEFPSVCIRAIVNKKYTVCGAENQDAHYSGNYWWADCNHIARLPPIHNRFDFMAPEFFVLRAHNDFNIARNFGYRCGYSLHNCGLNLYDNECNRLRFRDKLAKYVFHKLSASNRNPQDSQLSTCRELFKEPGTYKEQKDLLEKLFH